MISINISIFIYPQHIDIYIFFNFSKIFNINGQDLLIINIDALYKPIIVLFTQRGKTRWKIIKLKKILQNSLKKLRSLQYHQWPKIKR